MATTKLQTRILNKISTWTEWESVKTTFKPLRGEICIVEIPSGTSSTGLTPPATGIKVGDGQHVFGELPWIQAVAGDVTAWCKENMADFDKFKAQVAAAVADSEGGLQDAIDGLGQRITNLEATVNTGDNSNAKLRQAITAVDGKADANAQNITGLTSTKADKTQVATDIATAKTAVLGQKDGADFNGTVMGAYDAAATAKDAADAASEAAGKALTDAKAYTDGKVTDILGKNDDNSNFVGTVKGAYAAATSAQGKADTNAQDIVDIKQDIVDINALLGGEGNQSVSARLEALEEASEDHAGKIQNNTDAIGAEKERAEGVEAGFETRIATMENFWKAADDPVGTIDKLSEIVDYISKDESGAIDMAKDIEANTKAIEAEVERAGKAEADLKDAIDDLRGDALATDTLGTVKDLAEEAKQAASDNLNTAKGYTDQEVGKVLGKEGDAATVKTVYGAHAAAAAASAAAATADGKAVAAQGAADAAQDDADAANTAISKLLGSSVSEANGKISTISFADGKLTATRKEIVMADMSATEVFIFDCGSATVNAANLTV